MCSAAHNAQQNARFNKSAQQKRPCRPKTVKRFFGGPDSQGPSGQAKERTRILPVRSFFSAPGAPRHVPGWPFLRGLPLLCWLLCPVPVCLPCVLCAHFSLIFCLFLFGFCLSNFFSFVAHAATGTPFSFRKENGGKEPRGERRAAPLRTPFQRPAADLPFPRAAGRLKRPFGPQTAGR